MLSFKYYISEASFTDTPESLNKEMDEYIQAGEIINPKYNDLKSRVNRAYEKEAQSVQDIYLKTHRSLPSQEEKKKFSEEYDELYYGITSIVSIKKISKIAASKKENTPLVVAARNLATHWIPIAEKLKQLKPLVVLVTKKREEIKQIKQAERIKIFSDSSSLIKALEPAHKAFLEKYAEMASQDYDHAQEQLKKGLDIIAPAPSGSRDSREDYKSKERRREYYLKMSRTPKAHYVEEQKKEANADFQSWVEKLTDKIGAPVIEASMTGNPWAGSTLHVKTSTGESQSWSTQLIINRSKYDKLFNQFPTRKIK